MGIFSAAAQKRVDDVRCVDYNLIFVLKDGRTILVSLAWYPRLFEATPEQRAHWETSVAGYGIHRPDVNEHLSTERLLRGASALGWNKAA